MLKEEKVIMYDSPEAAEYRTGIEGWVSSEGIFWGKDEHMARWGGCTHMKCDCGNIMKRGWLKCEACREKERNKKYLEKPIGKLEDQMLYSETHDAYYSDLDEAWDNCADYEGDVDVNLEDLDLVICVPTYVGEFDPYDFMVDDIPEDGEVPVEIETAFEELNKKLKEYKTPLSWYPGKERVDPELFKEYKYAESE